MSSMKQLLKKILKSIPIDFTKNQQYDSQTKRVIAEVCSNNSCCIDIGAHKGEVLDIMLKHARGSKHFAFEPIPAMYEALVKKYAGNTHCTIHSYALSNKKGSATFNYVVSNPSYSGLIKRKYDRDNEQDTTIEVQTDLLDNILPDDYKPDLIKIDVEGGELLVLEGAINTLKTHRPVVIFEHGLGASDFYGSTPEKVYELFASCTMRVSTMHRWLNNRPSLRKEEFEAHYYQKRDYYFIAYP